MSVCNCLHPKLVHNKYTGEDIVVRCGKCDACRNSHVFQWVTRLDVEASCWKYVVFATLTFDEQHVAQMMKLSKEDSDFNNETDFILPTGEVISPSDVKAIFSERDKRFLESSQFLNVLDKRDFQLFIKRLRYYFDQCEKGALLRYFIGAEYGPETLRPHGHMLLFFNSKQCADQIQELLSKSWQNGAVYDPHFVNGSAASYCASYINSVSLLPKIYLHKSIQPFSLFSKRPAIGSLFPNVKAVREIFDRGDTKFSRYNSSTNKFEDVPFWRSFISRLYPRCQRFDSLSHADRVTLYRLIQEFPAHLSCREVADRIYREYIESGRDTFLSRYFSMITFGVLSYGFRRVIRGSEDVQSLPFPSPYRCAVFLPKDYLSVSVVSKPCRYGPLVRFVSAVRRVQYQSQVFGISIEEYVSKIELWYRKYARQHLVDDYCFQDEYFKHHPIWHIIYFDKQFYDKCTSVPYDKWSDYTRFTLEFLFDGDIPLTDGGLLSVPDYESMSFYHNYKVLEESCAHSLVKQKSNNDYAMLHKDKFENVLQYYSLS